MYNYSIIFKGKFVGVVEAHDNTNARTMAAIMFGRDADAYVAMAHK